jgi:hypothetical protein
MVREFFRLLFRSRASQLAHVTAPPVSRHRRARCAILASLCVFVVVSLTFSVVIDRVKPEWRDPEYGRRLVAARQWQRDQPERPLVLVFGSSRAQMGISPREMDLCEASSPVVYNFGYRAATPLVSTMLLSRALDDGLRPRAIVIAVSLNELHSEGEAEKRFASFGCRLSSRDMQRISPYVSVSALRQSGATSRWNPWLTYGKRTACEVFGFRDANTDCDSWRKMDANGYVPFPMERMSANDREFLWNQAREQAVQSNDGVFALPARQALHDVVHRCRASGIAVAIVWAPESPTYRELYSATGLHAMESHTNWFRTELGVPVFAAANHLSETDFADGYHLTPTGAAKYSQWLTETHLRAWLAKVLKSE